MCLESVSGIVLATGGKVVNKQTLPLSQNIY